MRLGIFGGTFNPVHLGHLRAAEEVRFKAQLDKIIFIPAGNPPLKAAELVDESHRYDMAIMATDSNEHFIVSDIELRQPEKSYTVNTIQRLVDAYPEDELFFILGIDAFLDMPNWWMTDKLISMIDFIVIERPGFNLTDIMSSPYITECKKMDAGEPDKKDGTCFYASLSSGKRVFLVQTTHLDISSTAIRKLLRENMSVKYLLPEAVEEYIYENGLYNSGK